MEQLIDQVRTQIRDKTEPYLFNLKTDESPDELENFVQHALIDYSRYNPIDNKIGSLVLKEGVSLYDLPSDLMEMNSFPFPHQVIGLQLLLIDPPEVTMSVPYSYKAARDAKSVPLQDRPCVVWFASAQALRAVISDSKKLDTYTSYKLQGVIEVDSRDVNKVITMLKDNASTYERLYNERIIPSESNGNDTSFATFG